MNTDDTQGRALFAGAVAGAAGFATFLVVHALWIIPIWSIVPALMWAVLGGIAVGWAYDVHRVRLPAREVGRVAAVLACASLALIPAQLVALPFGPFDRGAPTQSTIATGVTELALSLSITTVLGALLGALLGRSRRAAAATGLAAFAFASGIGHNIPFFGFGWIATKMWTIMLAASASTSVTLVLLDAWASWSALRTSPKSDAIPTSSDQPTPLELLARDHFSVPGGYAVREHPE